MPNDGLNSGPALAAFALFVLLVAIVAFKRGRGQDDVRLPHGLRATVTAVADANFHGFAAAVFAVREYFRQGLAVMQVVWMANHANDDIGFGGGGNGDFVAVFVGLMIFALADAIHLGFMQRINFIVVFGLLMEHAFVEQEVFLVAFEQGVARQASAQFPNQGMGNRAQAFQGFLGLGPAAGVTKVSQL